MTSQLTQVPSEVAREVAAGGGLSCPMAARRFPSYRGSRPVSAATISRWINDGVRLADGRRVRLEAVRNAGRFLTTEEAIARFLAAQSRGRDAEDLPTPRPPSARRKASAAAEEELRRRGC